jgi:menaquinone-dependent protoporphyrinogen oxidase
MRTLDPHQIVAPDSSHNESVRNQSGAIMATVGIFYATRYGHARLVAGHVADYFRTHGFDADVWPVLNVPDGLDLGKYSAIVVTASVHAGRHEPEMVRFVRQHRLELDKASNAFITITLSQAGAEREDATRDQRHKAAAEVDRMSRLFIADTGWQPQRIQPVAGALLYTKYNPFLRFVMKWISRMAGGSTDTTRDHIYTNWAALNKLAAGIADDVRGASGASVPAAHAG